MPYHLCCTRTAPADQTDKRSSVRKGGILQKLDRSVEHTVLSQGVSGIAYEA